MKSGSDRLFLRHRSSWLRACRVLLHLAGSPIEARAYTRRLSLSVALGTQVPAAAGRRPRNTPPQGGITMGLLVERH